MSTRSVPQGTRGGVVQPSRGLASHRGGRGVYVYLLRSLRFCHGVLTLVRVCQPNKVQVLPNGLAGIIEELEVSRLRSGYVVFQLTTPSYTEVMGVLSAPRTSRVVHVLSTSPDHVAHINIRKFYSLVMKSTVSP